VAFMPKTQREWRAFAAQLLWLSVGGAMLGLVAIATGEVILGGGLLVVSIVGIIRAVHLIRR